MGNKGTQTREMILARTAQLFSRQGYFGSSLTDIMKETGLEKGGIYNHFTSKDELALESFDYAVSLVSERIREGLVGKTHAVERLIVLVKVFQNHFENPVIIGGCPILNTAIEADDAHPALREKARVAMDTMRGTVRRILEKGIERNEIKAATNVEAVTSVFISTLEGALMMSKLYGDAIHLCHAADFLITYVEAHLKF